MHKKNIVIIFIGFGFGIITCYAYFSLLKLEKNSKIEQKFQNRITINDFEEQKRISSKNKKIPIFIKSSLQDLNISIDEITQSNWNEFLNKIRKKTLYEIVHNSEYEKGNTLIHILSKGTNIDRKLMKKLIDKGLDINAKNGNNTTPLMLVMKNSNNLKDIRALIEMGADISMLDDLGMDVLSYALLNKNSTIKREILKYLSDNYEMNIHDNPDKYLLPLSSSYKNKSYIIDVLPKLDKNNYKKNLFDLLRGRESDDEIINFFVNNGLNIDIELVYYMSMNKNISTNTMQLLLNKNSFDINQDVHNSGYTPLMAAVMFGDTKKIELYLKNGADPYLVNANEMNTFDLFKKSKSEFILTQKEKIEIESLLDNYKKK